MNLEPWEENDKRATAWRKFIREHLEIAPDEILNEKHVCAQFSLRDMWSAHVNGYKNGFTDSMGGSSE